MCGVGEGTFSLTTVTLAMLLTTYNNGDRAARATIRARRIGPTIGITGITIHPMSRIHSCMNAMRTRIGGGVTPRTPNHVGGVFMRINSRMHGNRGLMRVSTTGLRRLALRVRGRGISFTHIGRLCTMNNISGTRFSGVGVSLRITRDRCGGVVRGARLLDPVSNVIATHGCSGNSLCTNTTVLAIRRVHPIGLLIGMSRGCCSGMGGNSGTVVALSTLPNRGFATAMSLGCPAVGTTARAFPMRLVLDGRSRGIHPNVFTHTRLGFNARRHIMIPSVTVIGRPNSNRHFICMCGRNGMGCIGMRLNRHLSSTCRLLNNIPSNTAMIVTNRNQLTSNVRIEIRG